MSVHKPPDSPSSSAFAVAYSEDRSLHGDTKTTNAPPYSLFECVKAKIVDFTASPSAKLSAATIPSSLKSTERTIAHGIRLLMS